MYVIRLQVYFVHTFKLRFGKQEGVSALQRKTSSVWYVLLCESDDQQCHQQQQHTMKNMTITCLNLTQICISIVHHQFWFYKGAVTLGPFLPSLHQCTDAPFPCPPIPRCHALTLTVQRPSADSIGWATPSLKVLFRHGCSSMNL